MDELLAFLKARYDEAEAWAQDRMRSAALSADASVRFAPSDHRHVRLDIAMKRALLAETIQPYLHRRGEDAVGNNAWTQACLMALPYEREEGYKQEWKV